MSAMHEHMYGFMAALEAAHPFNTAEQTATNTLRQRIRWCARERETGRENGVTVDTDPQWSSALHLIQTFYRNALGQPQEGMRTLGNGS